MLQSRRILSSVVIALAVVLSLPALAGAETWNSAADKPHPEVADQLKGFKRKAVDLRRAADSLQSFTGNGQLSWQSHAHQQTELKEHINQMGQMLAELESQKHVASDTQRMAMEQVRPHLVAAAQNLTQAMELVEERRSHIRHLDYAEAVRNLYDHSENLFEKLDTILDYEKSKLRFESMEFQPASPEAKS
jgi:uncharacterized protein YdiU (UPF0061 family)